MRLALLLLLMGCGVKAAPQPPGIPAARRGEPERPCPGCELPSPDSYPTPSTGTDLSGDGEDLGAGGAGGVGGDDGEDDGVSGEQYER